MEQIFTNTNNQLSLEHALTLGGQFFMRPVPPKIAVKLGNACQVIQDCTANFVVGLSDRELVLEEENYDAMPEGYYGLK